MIVIKGRKEGVGVDTIEMRVGEHETKMSSLKDDVYSSLDKDEELVIEKEKTNEF